MKKQIISLCFVFYNLVASVPAFGMESNRDPDGQPIELTQELISEEHEDFFNTLTIATFALHETIFIPNLEARFWNLDEDEFTYLEDIIDRHLSGLSERQRLILIDKVIAFNPKAYDLLNHLQYVLLEPSINFRPDGNKLQEKPVSGIKIHYGAACQGKDADEISENQRSSKGEDGHFTYQNASITALGVADGVGGSTNPRFYVERLMTASTQVAAFSQFSPGDIMLQSYDFTKLLHSTQNANTIQHNAGEISGSTTASNLTIEHATGKCKIANYGDSSVLVVRNREVVVHIKERQCCFNTPYAFGFYRDRDPCEINQKFMTNHEFYVLPGDIIILATDGLFDNLFDSEIIDCIEQTMPTASVDGAYATKIAKQLVTKARDKINKGYTGSLSPFCIAAYECLISPEGFEELMNEKPIEDTTERWFKILNNYIAYGVKADDITAIVAIVADGDKK